MRDDGYQSAPPGVYVLTTVMDCPRCDARHDALMFSNVDNPNPDYEYWAECPHEMGDIFLNLQPREEA